MSHLASEYPENRTQIVKSAKVIIILAKTKQKQKQINISELYMGIWYFQMPFPIALAVSDYATFTCQLFTDLLKTGR